jgi:hypothetical protein
MISYPMVRSAHTVHLACIDTNTISKQTEEIPHDPRRLGVPSGVSKMISKPMVRLAHTVHLSCTDTNTVSKQTKMRFHMTQVT